MRLLMLVGLTAPPAAVHPMLLMDSHPDGCISAVDVPAVRGVHLALSPVRKQIEQGDQSDDRPRGFQSRRALQYISLRLNYLHNYDHCL